MEKDIFKIFDNKDEFYNQINAVYQEWNKVNNISRDKRNYDTRSNFFKNYLSFLKEDRENIKEHYKSKGKYYLENKRMDNNAITEQSLRELFKNMHTHHNYIKEFDYSFIPKIDYKKGIYHDFIYSDYDVFLKYYQSDYVDWVKKNGYKNASKKDYYKELIKSYKRIIKKNKKSEWSFIFKDDSFLYKKIIGFLTTLSKTEINKNTELKKFSDKTKLSMNQVALKYVYSGLQITRNKGNEVAQKYGYNSGEKLFQKFTYYSSNANRKSPPHPFTVKKLLNKIGLIESIIPLLSKENQNKVKNEVLSLKNYLKEDF